jgi:hypothetical protein
VDKVPEEIDQLDAKLLLTLRAHPRIGLLETSRRLGVARDNGHLQDVINGMLQKGAVQRSMSAISMTRQIPYRVEPLISAAVES